jgi:putative glutamine amidotransferase
MIQHLEGHRTPEGGPTGFHAVQIDPQSRLHAIVGRARLPVNTFHHQGLDAAALAGTFVPAAVAEPDAWLVEAYESPGHAWVVGVQWHPERVFELDEGHQRIWASFCAACAARKAAHRA